jgi:precorrin-2 dehydrogenase/sirohydrochlorin ferrochelatase
MHYPLFLDLADQPVVVIGAGNVATRKIHTLLAVGARVTVISPKINAAIRQLTRENCVRWIRRKYRRGDLRGVRLVIAATDDPAINELICVEANRRKLLVNCVAPPSAGNFIVPSQLQRGGITLAISTGGASPAFAKRLRLDLERLLSDGYPDLLKKMAAERRARSNKSKQRS